MIETIKIKVSDDADFERVRDAADRGEYTPPGCEAVGLAYHDPERPGYVCLDVESRDNAAPGLGA